MRRNRHGMRRPRNPIAIALVVLVALVVILAIALIATNSKYQKVRKELNSTKAELTAYQNEEKEREEAEKKAEQEKKDAEEKALEKAENWLNLSGHSEFSVKPTVFFDKYYPYSTTDKLRLRAGPGTNYDNIVTIPENTKIQAAAKKDDWTFVSYDGKFGWVKTEYLKLLGEEPKEASATEETKEPEKTGEKEVGLLTLPTSAPAAEAVAPTVKD